MHKKKVKVSKAYLDKHHLELLLAEVMQAVLRDWLAVPVSFIAERLLRDAHMITHLQPDKSLSYPKKVQERQK